MITRPPASHGLRLLPSYRAGHSALSISLCTQRQAHTSPSANRIPAPTPFVPDVSTFLKLIGRDCKQYESKLTSWEVLFGSSSKQLRALGIEPPRTRRYLMSWREKFRQGDFGVWGGLQHVQDGVAELRIVDREGKKRVVNTALSSIGRAEAETGEEQTEAGAGASAEDVGALLLQEPADAVVARDAKVAFPGVVAGPHCLPVKGTGGRVARIKAIEGLWEHKRGHKVGGGERWVRRAKTLVARRRRGIKAA